MAARLLWSWPCWRPCWPPGSSSSRSRTRSPRTSSTERVLARPRKPAEAPPALSRWGSRSHDPPGYTVGEMGRCRQDPAGRSGGRRRCRARLRDPAARPVPSSKRSAAGSPPDRLCDQRPVRCALPGGRGNRHLRDGQQAQIVLAVRQGQGQDRHRESRAGASGAAGSLGRVSSGKPRGHQSLRVPCLSNPPDDAVVAHLKGQQFAWYDFEGPTDEDLAKLAKLIDLHPLTLEDAHTFGQRPKIEEYDGYMFMVVFGVDPGAEAGSP